MFDWEVDIEGTRGEFGITPKAGTNQAYRSSGFSKPSERHTVNIHIFVEPAGHVQKC